MTAVELMPVHQFVHDSTLVEQGLSNYWGYNTIGFFAPHNDYACFGTRGEQVQEFKTMVRTLHRAGIEVILDVVYNHTAEGNHLGPTLSFRGIDNQAYYRLVDGDPQLLLRHHRHRQQPQRPPPRVAAADHGLAAVLGDRDARRRVPVRPGLRAGPGVPRGGPAGRVLRPGQPGPGGQPGQADRRAVGRRRGRLPGRRVPAVVDGVERQVPRHRARLLARRAGEPRGVRRRGSPASSDLYEADGRRPIASINFVTAHDGFTLHDLVSYNDKHNEANGEGNSDGESHNRSWNHGVEGPTDDPEIEALRERQKRNILATLLLSQGVPMIAHGDELGRTQRGNNNVYCQDNELCWVDWDDARDNDVLTVFTARLTALRAAHPIFRRQRFFQGRPIQGRDKEDIAWLHPDGRHMADEGLARRAARASWSTSTATGIPDRDQLGERVVDDSFLLLFNAQHRQTTFTLPDESYGRGLAGRRRHQRPAARSNPPPPFRGPVTASESRPGRCGCCAAATYATTAAHRGRWAAARCRRKVVILDEPTFALGVKEGNRVLQLSHRPRPRSAGDPRRRAQRPHRQGRAAPRRDR